MQVQIYYQSLDHSQWVEEFIAQKMTKLERYLNQSATVQVNLKYEKQLYVSSLVIHNLSHDYAFSAQGENLYESFTGALDKAARSLGEHKRMAKDKINKRFYSLRSVA